MSIKFYWRGDGENKRPYCEPITKNNKKADFLSCLLSDDGGLGIKYNIDWTNEVLNSIGLMKKDGNKYFDISKECWGVELKGSVAKVYFTYDEDEFVLLKTNEIETAVISWQKFLLEG